jgi:NitT/TauT family transport system ATP-binding protein
MHALIARLWSEYALTVVMVTHDIKEAFALGTRVLALDKRRHDPHAPHRFGATVVYDLPLNKPGAADVCVGDSITIDSNDNN